MLIKEKLYKQRTTFGYELLFILQNTKEHVTRKIKFKLGNNI